MFWLAKSHRNEPSLEYGEMQRQHKCLDMTPLNSSSTLNMLGNLSIEN